MFQRALTGLRSHRAENRLGRATGDREGCDAFFLTHGADAGELLTVGTFVRGSHSLDPFVYRLRHHLNSSRTREFWLATRSPEHLRVRHLPE